VQLRVTLRISERDHVNVGIGYVLSHYRQAIDAAPYDLQRRFISRLRGSGHRRWRIDEEAFTPSLIPVGGPLPAPAGPRAARGRCRRVVNGVHGRGDHYAMVSEISQRKRAGPGGVSTVARRYRRACDYEIAPNCGFGAHSEVSVADRRRIARVIAGAHVEQVITRLILDFAVGRVV